MLGRTLLKLCHNKVASRKWLKIISVETSSLLFTLSVETHACYSFKIYNEYSYFKQEILPFFMITIIFCKSLYTVSKYKLRAKTSSKQYLVNA